MLVRLVNTPRRDWDAKRRVWVNRDGWLGEVVQQGGIEPYRFVVVRLYRRHRGTGQPLPIKEDHLRADQVVPVTRLSPEEERLVEAYQPLVAQHQRRKDRDMTGRVLWLGSYGEGSMGRIGDSLLVDTVRDELVREAATTAEKTAVARYFLDNTALLVLIAARFRQQSDAPGPAPTVSATNFSFVDTLGRPMSLHPETERLDEDLEDRTWFEGREDIALLRSLADEDWSVSGHFDGRLVRPKWRDVYDRAPNADVDRDLLVAQIALLSCPDRRLVARLPPDVVEWLARSAGHYLHCQEVAGWDYSGALRLALYDVLCLLWEHRYAWDKSARGDGPPFVAMRTFEGLLLGKPPASLGGGPLAVWFLALCVKRLLPDLLPGSAVPHDAFVKVAAFLASRASGNPKNQLFLSLPNSGPDIPRSALEAAIQTIAPSVTESLPSRLVELIQARWRAREDEPEDEP